jgi:hypothetical protein
MENWSQHVDQYETALMTVTETSQQISEYSTFVPSLKYM